MEPENDHPVAASCSTTLTPHKATTSDVNGAEEQYEMQNGGVDYKNKGKAIQLDSQSDDEQLDGPASDSHDAMNNDESFPGLLDLEEDDDDDYCDHYAYEIEDEHADEYVSEYQALFDAKEKEIPAGVEVAMDWLPNSEATKPSGSSKTSRDEHWIKPEATSSSSSSSKKATLGIQIDLSSFALPYNPKGFEPNSCNAVPHYSGLGLKYSPMHLGLPQTQGTVMGEASVPAPASASASSALSLQMKKKYPGGFSTARTLPLVEEVISAPVTSRVKRNVEDYLGKYLFFKKFDIVEDLVDHHYANKGTSSKQHSKEWAKRIQEEWKILENDLPEMIFVRGYESRMDLLRAVIVGADGTPYHDGLFFFDIFFPDAYPSVPPCVSIVFLM
ncbi:unnamed protein product [Eruca vesicaria subsp. sativa]|uniref:UBC core domain-containing protein n=1 Tax=Eruca vesicaria subsp. sativa TaxID=29727 RepID=A0ABC8IRQ0_ERUVS|nr:unnamed protein product [Eruca vesicaria subsp. sativa]